MVLGYSCGEIMDEEKVFFKGALTGALVTLVAVGAILFLGLTQWSTVDWTVYAKLNLIQAYIDDMFLYDVDEDELEEWIYKGYVDGLDDVYAGYYTVEETETLLESSSGEYSGIGAAMSQDMTTGLVTLITIFEDSPAEEAGILAGDILYKVNGELITSDDLTNIVAQVKGDEGTTVEITILRGEDMEEYTYVVTRGIVEDVTVEYQLLDDNVGYILVTEFDTVTLAQFEAALEALEAQGMERLVIDLRNNPGGNLDTVCDMLRLLLPEGLIVYTQDKDGNVEEEYCDGENEFDMPLAVLVNEYSASASEIFAGAVQDYGIGTIVGETTYGKGIVQTLITLPDNSLLKITTSEYYTPLGRNIHGIGIEPDIEVIEDGSDEDTDIQLNTAIEALY